MTTELEPSSELVNYIGELETLSDDLPFHLLSAQWLQDFREARYEASLSALDSVLSEEPNNLLARLVWIRSHLAARQLPVTALCSPLEDLPLDHLTLLSRTQSAQLESESRILPRFAKALYLQSAFLLDQSGQGRLAWSMTEKALALPLAGEPAGEDLVRTYALNLLEQEIERADQKRESAAYKSTLQDAKQNIIETRSTTGDDSASKKESVTPVSSLSYSLTAKQIAENAPHPIPPARSAEPIQPNSKLSGALVSVGLLAVGAGLYHLWQSTNPPPQKPSAPIQLAVLERTPLIPPPLETSANRPLDQKLENVGKRLENMGKPKLEAAEPKTIDSSQEVDTAALDPANAKGLSLPVSAASDELVSIDGKSQDEENIPAFDPRLVQQGATQQVQSLGDSERRQPIPPAALGEALKVDPKGRVFGPASNQDRASAHRTPTALDGSPLRSYEVEQFTPPQLYKTITATRVLSAPSILSSTLAELPESTPVHVSARMGQWLELRSTGGRVGYIFSQDATISK